MNLLIKYDTRDLSTIDTLIPLGTSSIGIQAYLEYPSTVETILVTTAGINGVAICGATTTRSGVSCSTARLTRTVTGERPARLGRQHLVRVCLTSREPWHLRMGHGTDTRGYEEGADQGGEASMVYPWKPWMGPLSGIHDWRSVPASWYWSSLTCAVNVMSESVRDFSVASMPSLANSSMIFLTLS